MKYLILISILFIALDGFGQQKRIPFVQELEYQYVGPVKQIEVYTQYFSRNLSKCLKKELKKKTLLRSTFKFDEAGNLFELLKRATSISGYSETLLKNILKYDEHDNMERLLVYLQGNPDSLVGEVSYAPPINNIYEMCEVKDKPLCSKFIYDEKERLIEVWNKREKGWKLSTKNFYSNELIGKKESYIWGELERSIIYKYDSNNRLILESYFDIDDKLLTDISYEYIPNDGVIVTSYGLNWQNKRSLKKYLVKDSVGNVIKSIEENWNKKWMVKEYEISYY